MTPPLEATLTEPRLALHHLARTPTAVPGPNGPEIEEAEGDQEPTTREIGEKLAETEPKKVSPIDQVYQELIKEFPEISRKDVEEAFALLAELKSSSDFKYKIDIRKGAVVSVQDENTPEDKKQTVTYRIGPVRSSRD